MAVGQIPGAKDSDAEEDGLFSEINITPLTDIFLVLLIIFMITSSVMFDVATPSENGGVKVQVAGGIGSSSTETVAPFLIVIDDRGQVLVSGVPMQTNALADSLALLKKQNASARVIIQPADEVPYRYVLPVLAIVQRSGLAFAISGKQRLPKP